MKRGAENLQHAFTDLAKMAFCLVWTFVPVFCGVFLHYFVWPNGQQYVSLIWAVVFGLSDWILYPVPYSLEHPWPVLPFVQLGWPLIVAFFLSWSSPIVWERLALRGRWAAVAILLCLSSPIITLARDRQPPFNHWPTYENVMASLW